MKKLLAILSLAAVASLAACDGGPGNGQGIYGDQAFNKGDIVFLNWEGTKARVTDVTCEDKEVEGQPKQKLCQYEVEQKEGGRQRVTKNQIRIWEKEDDRRVEVK